MVVSFPQTAVISAARILIVEDEGIIASHIAACLVKAGYEVAGIAVSSNEALAKTRELNPDLILMDIRINGAMDGIETATNLRKRFDIPIIYLSAHTDQQTIDRAKMTGASGFLTKPIHQAILASSVAAAIHKHRTSEDGDRESWMSERASQLESANAQMAELAATLDKTQAIIQKLDGTILYWSSGAESMYGWSRQDALGRKSHELLATERSPPLEEIQAELLKHGSWSGEYRHRRRDGSMIWVASHWALHRDSKGDPASVVKVNNDITELKRTGEALRTSEATARSLFENASQGILTVDRAGRIVDANTMVQGLFGYGGSELIGAPVEMLLPESFRARHMGHRANYALQPHARPMGLGMDLVGRRKDGSEFPVEISLSFVAEHQSGGLAMAFISDITARNQANRERDDLIARLEGALSEKVVLLKEVHHRVKNNLAVIAGLLGMQADAIDDERLTMALEKSQRRVASIALVHEYLYSTEHLDRVNFGKYLHQLADELCASHAVSDLISVAIEVNEIDLPVHRAIPCGLILNELLSNALKYGFPEGRSGKIKVQFAEFETGMLSLSCWDDGVGIPESFDWQNAKSLGLKIVQILAKQIDGEITLDRSGGGTRFELLFSATGKHEQN